MTCQRCGATYTSLVCPDCIERACRVSSMRQQPEYLEKVRAGTFDFILARFQNHKPHVQLFGDPNRSFCGISLTNSPRRTRCAYWEFVSASVCSQCAQIIAEILETTTEAPPR